MNKVRYAVPNAFTSLNFLMGTFAIALAPMGNQIVFGGKTGLEWSAWLIIYAVLFDKLDGFFAKRLNASSEFGAQLDSLADLISFGVAPAILVLFSLRTLAESWFNTHFLFAIGAMCLYVLCAAFRLARYNVLQSDVKGYFVGMPSTLAGGWVAMTVLLMTRPNWFGIEYNPAILVAAEFVLAVLMVSELYLSKLVRRNNRFFNLFQIANIFVGYAFGLAQKYPEILVLQITLYTVFGFLWGIVFRKRIEAQFLHNA
jgi:CDP-diacylglycerol---serine O-phosphatidyltransferase